MDFVVLSMIFLGTGLLALGFNKIVPTAEAIKKRLPNKVSWAGVIGSLVIGFIVWYVIKNTSGFRTVIAVFTLLLALLVFESFFLFLMRWIKSNLLVFFISLVFAGGLVFIYIEMPTFVLRNIIVIIATLGATTLLVRLDILRTWVMFGLAFIWTIYDIMVTRFVFPEVLVPVTEPKADLFFPAVVTGSTSLGSGDFIFLVLFLLIIIKDFGYLSGLIMLGMQTLGLMVTGLMVTGTDFIIPFLVIMSPIFGLNYLYFYLIKRSKKTNSLV